MARTYVPVPQTTSKVTSGRSTESRRMAWITTVDGVRSTVRPCRAAVYILSPCTFLAE
jgi:hypothetical protein